MVAMSTHVAFRELSGEDLSDAARLLGNVTRDNPINAQAFCLPDPAVRERVLVQFFKTALAGLSRRGSIVGAFDGHRLVGVAAATPPGRCQPKTIEKLAILPAMLRANDVPTSLRLIEWTKEWSRYDPVHAHWHLGPIGVHRDNQRRGIGSAMLDRFCRRMDDHASVAYLETDRVQTVAFYWRFGFRTVAQAQVLGVPNWFMQRVPSSK